MVLRARIIVYINVSSFLASKPFCKIFSRLSSTCESGAKKLKRVVWVEELLHCSHRAQGQLIKLSVCIYIHVAKKKKLRKILN